MGQVKYPEAGNSAQIPSQMSWAALCNSRHLCWSSDAVLPDPSFPYCLRQPELMLCPWPASAPAGSQMAGH